MMVLRKLAVALLSAGVMLPGLANALAVLDTKTKSALGEPYRAEIELSDVGDLGPEEIRASLATADDFERLGIERAYFLTDLKFNVVLNSSGRSYISVTSSKPVREPFLNYVVRIDWPGNARMHEVTSLLDLPMLGDVQAAPVQQAEAATATVEAKPIVKPVEPANVVRTVTDEPASPKPEPVTQPKPATRPSTVVATPAPVSKPREPQPVPVLDDNYRTKSGDTLWAVALKVRPASDLGVQQTMIALQKENPGAFTGNNINQLKRGQVLRIPSEAQIREISTQQAVASVRNQNAAWRGAADASEARLNAQQLDATAKPDSAPKNAGGEAKAEMTLLAPGSGKQAGAAGGSGKPQSAETGKKLDKMQAEGTALKQENKTLSTKVGTLDAKVKENDKKLELQNAKLAELQANLKAQEAQKAKPADTTASAPVPAEKPAADKQAAQPAAENSKSTELVAQQPAQVEPGIESKPLPEVAKKPAKPAVKPAPAEEVAGPEIPWLPIGGGLAALLLGGFLFLKKRREKAEEEAAMAELEAMESEGASFEGAAATEFEPELGLDDDFAGLGGLTSGADEAPLFQDNVLADPMEEVEQYLAYERYPQAVGFLNKAIAAAPGREDLRLKLMEVYAHLDDHKGFAEQEVALEGSADLDVLSRIEELKAGMSPEPRTVTKDDAIEFESAGTPSDSLLSDDLPSLEELEMDFNASVSASSTNLKAVDDSLDMDFSSELSSDALVDEDFSFQKTEAPALDGLDLSAGELDLDLSAVDAPAKIDEDISFSLDADFGMEPASSSESSLSGSSFDEIDLADFDVDAKPAASHAPDKGDDLSFSLDDLEVVEEKAALDVGSLDGDFALEDSSRSNTVELSLDSADFAAGSELNDMAAEFDMNLSPESVAVESVTAPAAAPAVEAAVSADLGMDDEFDFLADTDENATKLDLAKAYIDMGDMEGARDILQEVLSEGNMNQKDEAKGLLAQVG